LTHAAGPVDDELIGMVAAIAIGDPDPAERVPAEDWNGGSVDIAALNSTRGAAALAIGNLVAEEPTRLRLVQRALDRLVADPQPEVRAAAAAAVAPLLLIDPTLALTMFHDAVDDVPGEVLGSRYVQHFVQPDVMSLYSDAGCYSTTTV